MFYVFRGLILACGAYYLGAVRRYVWETFKWPIRILYILTTITLLICTTLCNMPGAVG